VAFDDALVEAVNPLTLPSDWSEEPPPPSSQAIGDLWVRKAPSAVLEIPSVIIPSETNYLINPKHPDFHKIHIGKPVPFAFDSRLI
jgi:RES domain-containing protein